MDNQSNQRYKLIQGLPQEVEEQVNSLMERGWLPSGDPILYTPSTNSSQQIIIQCMIFTGEKYVRPMGDR